LLAVAPVLVSELPHLQRVLLAPLEALQPLLVRDVEPELDQDHSLVGERALEAVDLVVGSKPLLAGGEALDSLDEHPPVPGAVDHGQPTPSRQQGEEAP